MCTNRERKQNKAKKLLNFGGGGGKEQLVKIV